MFNKMDSAKEREILKRIRRENIITWVLSIGIVLITLLIGAAITLGVYYVYTVVAGVEFTLRGFLTYFFFFT